MNKLYRRIVCSALAACIGLLPAAQAFATVAPTSACTTSGVEFGFFNGVQTTQDQATEALVYLRQQFGAQTAQGEAIRYESFYNYSHGFEDFVETFDQRLAEHDSLLAGRFELFAQALQGNGDLLSAIQAAVPATSSLFTSIVNDFEAFVVQKLTTLLANPPTLSNYIEHQGRIDTLTLEGKKLLFFAHSQGNLFVNQAYNYALTKVTAQSVKVVHAAPASVLLNGDYTLADKDLVINGLRLTGSVPANTDTVPAYLDRQPGLNGKKDFMGHGLLEIYLNPTLTTASHLKTEVAQALNSLVAPPVLAAAGFLTATLTWDGAGDVDLHTYEPDGSHVWYSQRQGTTGYLDVDNTTQYGPEHYYASCDASKIQTGTYTFKVANYYGATGRVARLQLSSDAGGVLGTVSTTLGAATGSNPSVQMLSVNVTKDPVTGVFSAAVN